MNEAVDELHSMTDTQQRVTSAYHPQSNGLVERQNRTIKNTLVKVLDQNLEHWPYVIDGVLFAHWVSCHASTNYSPFYCVCVKRIAFCNCLCSSPSSSRSRFSASLIRNIGEVGATNFFTDHWTANTVQFFVPTKRTFFGSISEQVAAMRNSLKSTG